MARKSTKQQSEETTDETTTAAVDDEYYDGGSPDPDDGGSEVTSLFDVYVDQGVYDEANTKPIIKSGSYQAKIGRIDPERDIGGYPGWHDGAGHNRMRVGMTLYNDDGEAMGRKFIDVSWERFDIGIGRGGTHPDCLMYGKLQRAVVGDAKASVGDTIMACEDAIVSVYGKEFFRVPVSALPEDVAEKYLDKGKSLDSKVNVYVDANDDALRDHLLEGGHDSDFRIFSINPARKAEA